MNNTPTLYLPAHVTRYVTMKSGDRLALTKTIRANHRFIASRATWGGRTVFCKQPQAGMTSADELTREVEGLMAFNQFARDVAIPFCVPRLLYHDDSLLVTTFVDGYQTSMYTVPPEFWVRSFVAMDRYFRQPVRRLPRWARPSRRGRYIWEDMEYGVRKTAEWAIYPGLLADCLAYLRRYATALEARPMHADFTDGNTMFDNKNYWVIDFESFRPDWPRWYDVVNFTYNRMITRPEVTDQMQLILSQTVEQLGESPTTAHEIRFSAIMRGLSFLIEGTTPGGKGHASTNWISEERRYRVVQSLRFLVSGGDLTKM